MGRTDEAESCWRGVQEKIVGQPFSFDKNSQQDDWVLGEVRGVMGDLVPASSRLHEWIEKTQR